jgi:resorcinol 4-hydroxylase (FADH2)
VTASTKIEELVTAARSLAPMLKARAEQTERDRRVSPEVTAAIREAGLYKVLQPAHFGGLELDISTLIRINLVLGAACASTAWCTGLAILHNWLVGLYPQQAQQDVWSDPGVIVAGSTVPAGKCARAPGGYKLQGSWPFASNCDYSGWYYVGAMVSPAVASEPPVLTWFLVPARDARIEDTWFTSGLAGTGSKTIVLENATFVPEHRTLPVSVINSGAAPGASANPNPLYRLTFTGAAPFVLSSLALGMAAGAIEAFAEIARTRTAIQLGGPPLPMSGLTHVQLAISDASAAVDAGVTLLLRDAGEMEAGLARGELPSTAQRLRNRRDHAYGARLAVSAANTVFEALGANVSALSHPVQRAWRDVNIAARHISLSWPMVGTMFGQSQLGLDPKGVY